MGLLFVLAAKRIHLMYLMLAHESRFAIPEHVKPAVAIPAAHGYKKQEQWQIVITNVRTADFSGLALLADWQHSISPGPARCLSHQNQLSQAYRVWRTDQGIS